MSHFERRYSTWLWAIVAFGVVIRVVVYLDLSATNLAFNSPSLDSGVFLDWAGRIASGDLLGDRVFFLNPLYPYFIAPLVGLFGDHALNAIRIVQVLLGLLTVLLVAGATRRFAGPAPALLAALVTAVYPFLLVYEQKVMIVTLAVFLNALTLWLVSRFLDRPGLRTAFLAGIPLGLSVLARPNVGLFVLLLPIWFLSIAPAGRRLRFAVVRTAILVLGTAVVVLPVTIRNWVVGDDFVLVTSSAGVNLWQSNNPLGWKNSWMASEELRSNPYLVEDDSIFLAERETGRKLKPSEVSKWWTDKTRDLFWEHPREAWSYLGRKALMFFRSYEIPSSYSFEDERRESWFLWLIPISFGVISPFMLVGTVFVLLKDRRGLPLVLFLACYAVGLTIFFPLAHYRAPVIPAATALAAIGAVQILRVIRSGDRRAAAIWLLLLAGFAIPVHGPVLGRWIGLFEKPTVTADLVAYHYNRGQMFLDRGDDIRAEREFRRGAAANPDSPLPFLGLAEVAVRRGELANEARFLEKALKRRPGDAEIAAHVGRNLVSLGERVEDGLRLIERAARDSPGSELIHVILADTYEYLGRHEDALREYRAARSVSRDPFGHLVTGVSLCLRKLGRYEEALRELDEAIGKRPQVPELYVERARVLEETDGDPEEIRQALLSARERGGEVPADLLKYLSE